MVGRSGTATQQILQSGRLPATCVTRSTPTAVASITRLVNMGLEPHLISSTVIAIAQRLVRTIAQIAGKQSPHRSGSNPVHYRWAYAPRGCLPGRAPPAAIPVTGAAPWWKKCCSSRKSALLLTGSPRRGTQEIARGGMQTLAVDKLPEELPPR